MTPAVFLFLLIALDFGFEIQQLYYVVIRVPDFEILSVGSSLSCFKNRVTRL